MMERTGEDGPRAVVPPETASRPPAKERCKVQEAGWDVVDEASWESFPASDPPGIVPCCADAGDALDSAERISADDVWKSRGLASG